ncbi:MAG: class II aldolase/adducin family protein [Methylophilaceae bacterium]|nr:class II aldolase/adducin family protein [Methylophilaceae bacterium]
MKAEREQLLGTMQKLLQCGLNRGTSGNASMRVKNGLLLTPTGIDVEDMIASDMVFMNEDGEYEGDRKPTSEWMFHLDILKQRPEIGAVIHTHSMFATTLACLRKDVPPFHYMIAASGGDSIRCAPYALFGSEALSKSALQALEGRRACLLANHGMIALGENIKQAFDVTVEVEALCEQYLHALQVGEPAILSEQEMREVFAQFKGYSKWGK